MKWPWQKWRPVVAIDQARRKAHGEALRRQLMPNAEAQIVKRP